MNCAARHEAQLAHRLQSVLPVAARGKPALLAFLRRNISVERASPRLTVTNVFYAALPNSGRHTSGCSWTKSLSAKRKSALAAQSPSWRGSPPTARTCLRLRFSLLFESGAPINSNSYKMPRSGCPIFVQ